MCTRNYITKEDIQVLREQGFVGDIAMNPVRRDGSYEDCPLTERLLTSDMECLKRIDNTVVVATGEEKAEAIRAVLFTGCVDTLIIDETTARKVMEDQ